MIEQDSTNVAARISLANALYDTANWDEAIVHYKSAMRFESAAGHHDRRPRRVLYNLSAFAVAESLFKQAIAIDPKLPQALFNLGVVAEQQQRWDEALDYYHPLDAGRRAARGASGDREAHHERDAALGQEPPPLNN
jgi:tetratricopeptide (TPR) repeat protein